MLASFSDASANSANSARRNEMESLSDFLPKEIFELIFSYVGNNDLNTILELPEFQSIYDDNYFWNILIAANFSKYYVPGLSGYNWRNIYYGLNLLFNIDPNILINIIQPDEKIETLILRNVPNLFWTYLNYTPEINLKIIKILRDNTGITFTNILGYRIEDIINKLIKHININYPETFVYLIQNDLITGNKKMVDEFTVNLIVMLDDADLIHKLLSKERIRIRI
jgi:hypothetical protein